MICIEKPPRASPFPSPPPTFFPLPVSPFPSRPRWSPGFPRMLPQKRDFWGLMRLVALWGLIVMMTVMENIWHGWRSAAGVPVSSLIGFCQPRPQAPLPGRARCTLRYGIDNSRIAWRCGNHLPPRPLFSRLTASTENWPAPGDEARFLLVWIFARDVSWARKETYVYLLWSNSFREVVGDPTDIMFSIPLHLLDKCGSSLTWEIKIVHLLKLISMAKRCHTF